MWYVANPLTLKVRRIRHSDEINRCPPSEYNFKPTHFRPVANHLHSTLLHYLWDRYFLPILPSMAPQGTIFIIGSGPMIGSHVARLFAEHGFEHLALFSRSTSNLSRNASFVTSAVPSASVHTYEADVTDHASLSAALEKAIS